MARDAAARLERTVVDLARTFAASVTGLALLPCIIAGLVLFRLTALEMLAIGVAVTVSGLLAARALRLPSGPLIPPALVGIALVSASAPVLWAGIVAGLVVGLEVARARIVPAARFEVGLLGYALALLASHSGVAGYVTTTAALTPLLGGAQAGVDPVRLYVGNVPGPVFATSLLAVAIGAAWMWYSRRLSLLTLLTFTTGALAALARLGGSPSLELVSGPLWFAAALILADRATLPSSPIGRPLMGLVAGALAVGARTWGYGLEAAPLAVAALQLVSTTLQGLSWAVRHRGRALARLRELRTARRPPELIG